MPLDKQTDLLKSINLFLSAMFYVRQDDRLSFANTKMTVLLKA